MAFNIRRLDAFYTTVKDKPGEAYKLLSALSHLGINLLAFTAIPFGETHTQLTICPEDTSRLKTEAERAGIKLDGPQPVILVQGDDKLGALAHVHEKLFAANINIYASNGLTAGTGVYGYIIYVKPDEFERAMTALNM